MKFLKKYKKYIFIVISIILMFFTFLSLVYVIEGNKLNNYEFHPDGDVHIKEIWINGSNQNLYNFSAANDLVYTEEGYSILNKDISVDLSSIYEFNVVFENGPDFGTVDIKKNNSEITKLDLYNDYENISLFIANDFSTATILNNYIANDFNVFHIFIILLSLIFNYISLILIQNFILKIRNDSLNYKTILGYFVASTYLIVNTIYILIEVFNKIAFIIYAIPLLIGLYFIRNNLKNKLHYLFIYLFIPIGISFIFTMPIGHIPDEPSHFYKSFILSQKVMLNDIDKDNDYCIDYYKTINGMIGEYTYDIHNYYYTLKPRAFYANVSKDYNIIDTDGEICFYNVSKLPFVAYTFTTTSLIISQILHLPFLLMFLLGRLINYLFYISIIYYCLKSIPKYKKSIFIISTLPIAIQAASGFNQDCVHNALFILLFTKIVQAINRTDKMSTKELLTIMAISIMLGFCKMGYFPVIFMCILIPSKRFKNKSLEIKYKLLLILPILISFIILYFTSFGGVSVPYDTESYYTIGSMLQHPFEVIRLYLNTVRSFWFYMPFQGMMDGFAWSTKYNTTIVNYFLAGSYAILLFTGPKKEKNDKFYIFVTLFSALLIILAIMTSMVTLTKIGANCIDGLQPRYFVTPLLLIISTLNVRFLNLKNNNYELLYGILMLIIYIGVFSTIIKGFYV